MKFYITWTRFRIFIMRIRSSGENSLGMGLISVIRPHQALFLEVDTWFYTAGYPDPANVITDYPVTDQKTKFDQSL